MPQTKAQKRAAADERHARYRSLTPEDRLAVLEGRRGESVAERKRLLRAIEIRGKLKGVK